MSEHTDADGMVISCGDANAELRVLRQSEALEYAKVTAELAEAHRHIERGNDETMKAYSKLRTALAERDAARAELAAATQQLHELRNPTVGGRPLDGTYSITVGEWQPAPDAPGVPTTADSVITETNPQASVRRTAPDAPAADHLTPEVRRKVEEIAARNGVPYIDSIAIANRLIAEETARQAAADEGQEDVRG